MTDLPARLWREAKLQRRCLLRWATDVKHGQMRLFSRKKVVSGSTWEFSLSLKQPIMPGDTLPNKLANITLAGQKIDQICLNPSQIFSFWEVVGRPSSGRGFLLSRNLVGGQISQAIGGGLCQVSGILYHLGLLGGLHIVERHPHSLDIYREDERFSPLGADATVVYGYKDLRIQNCWEFPVVFSVQVKEQQLVATLLSPQPIAVRDIEFQRSESTDGIFREVLTLCHSPAETQILSRSKYRVMLHKA